MHYKTLTLTRKTFALNHIYLSFLLLTAFGLSSCDDDSTTAEESTAKWRSPITSLEIVNEIHEKQLKELADYEAKNLAGFSIAKIKEIHQYMYNQRWTTGGDIALNHGTNYEKAAEELQIPVPQLKEADHFYDNKIRPQLSEMLENLLKGHSNVKLEYRRSLRATAYCGMNTVQGNIILYGKKEENELKQEAASIAEQLTKELPAWIDGFKLNYTTVNDTVLKIKKDVNVGFLWKRGEGIRQMKPGDGGWGYIKPTENNFWYTDEWNDLKEIQQPAFKEIHPADGKK